MEDGVTFRLTEMNSSIRKNRVKLNPVRAERELGWKPTWDEERFMGSMDEEIESFFRNGGNNAKVVA